jgi:hypothetical protein
MKNMANEISKLEEHLMKRDGYTSREEFERIRDEKIIQEKKLNDEMRLG